MTIVRSAVRYWGRKAGTAAELLHSILIKSLKNGGLILDPFAGAGSIGRRLLSWGYKVVMIDINFYAWLISRTLIGKVKLPSTSFWEQFDNTKLHIVRHGRIERVKWKDLFTIECRGIRSLISRRECDEEEQKCVVYTVSGCNVIIDYNDPIDEVLDPYPKLPLYYPEGVAFDKRRSVNYVYELYSPLMLAGMAGIANLLNSQRYSIKRGLVGPLLWLSLAAIAYSTSRMARHGAGAWAINCYWIPRRHAEYNPFLKFRRRVKAIARESLGFRTVYTAKSASRLRQLDYNAAILWDDATNVSNIFPKDYFDALITDPPHFDEIQYYELSFLHLAWLLEALTSEDRERALNAYKHEIVVNPRRGLGLNEYLRMLHNAFSSIALVLRRGAPTLIFLHEEQQYKLDRIIDAIESAGYRFINEINIKMPTKPIGDKSRASASNIVKVLIGRRELT
jgi:hypothetical protein